MAYGFCNRMVLARASTISSSSEPVPPKSSGLRSFKFMELPLEIRNMIYAAAFTTENTLTRRDFVRYSQKPGRTYDQQKPALLQLNSKIWLEALEVMMRVNTIDLIDFHMYSPEELNKLIESSTTTSWTGFKFWPTIRRVSLDLAPIEHVAYSDLISTLRICPYLTELFIPVEHLTTACRSVGCSTSNFFTRFRLCEELQSMERLRRIVVQWDSGIGRQELIAAMAHEFLKQRCEELGMPARVELSEQLVPAMQDFGRSAIAHWKDTKNGYKLS